MKLLALIIALLFPLPGSAAERGLISDRLLSSKPQRVIRLEKNRGRMPASMDSIRAAEAENSNDLDKNLAVGTYAIIRNSVEDWNNQIVRVVARFEDGSRKVQLDNGKVARIQFNSLHTLSPETSKCCKSHGVDLCKNDKVYHPVPSTSIGIPLGNVRRVFENCTMLVRDGLDFIYDSTQVGKAVDCSPQKESVCVGKIVYVEAFRNGRRYEFEGPVAQVFTNGTVLVRTGLWLMPVDAVTVKVQTDSLYSIPTEETTGAIISSRDGQRKIFVPTYPEIEPYDANDSQQLMYKRGLTVPAR